MENNKEITIKIRKDTSDLLEYIKKNMGVSNLKEDTIIYCELKKVCDDLRYSNREVKK